MRNPHLCILLAIWLRPLARVSACLTLGALSVLLSIRYPDSLGLLSCIAACVLLSICYTLLRSTYKQHREVGRRVGWNR